MNLLTYRFDLFFSYWIFLWYVLYIVGVLHASPKLILLFGLGVDLVFLALLLFARTGLQGLAFLSGTIVGSKLLPLATIYSEPIRWKRDLIIGFLVFAAYILYTLFQNRNPVQIYMQMMEAIRTRRFDPEFNPGMTLIHRLLPTNTAIYK